MKSISERLKRKRTVVRLLLEKCLTKVSEKVCANSSSRALLTTGNLILICKVKNVCGIRAQGSKGKYLRMFGLDNIL